MKICNEELVFVIFSNKLTL